jgi:hypothetical protein
MFVKELKRVQDEMYRLECQHENDLKVIDSLRQQLEKEVSYCQVNHAGCCPVQKIILFFLPTLKKED